MTVAEILALAQEELSDVLVAEVTEIRIKWTAVPGLLVTFTIEEKV